MKGWRLFRRLPGWAQLIVVAILAWAFIAASLQPEPEPTGARPAVAEDSPSATAEPSETQSSTTPSTSAEPSTRPKSTSRAFGLTVRREARADSYDRELFRHWTDADSDCLDTRAEVLQQESSSSIDLSETCRVITGRWRSLYDGLVITQARQLDVDHVVPLAEAWRSGAWRWSDDRRERFANDLRDSRTLRAVTLSTNRSKGDRDPAEWLPPARSSWCRYAKDWIAIKRRWELAADRAEVSALRSMLETCA